MSLTPDLSVSSSLCHCDSLSVSFYLHTQRLTHWITCPTFRYTSPSDWLGTLANSQSLCVYTAGWPVKGRVHSCVDVHACRSWINPNATSYISLLPPITPPLPPALHLPLAKPLHALSSSFLNYPPSLNPTS